MAATETKQKRAPKALWEVSKLMLRLAQNVFTSMRIEHAYKVKIAKLEAEKKKKIAEKKESHDALVAEIVSIMKLRRPEVEKTGSKSVTLATGQVGWREAAPRVEIVEGYAEKDVAKTLARVHKDYVRINPEINREKILQDFQAGTMRKHRGITVRSGVEELFISLAPRGKQKPKIITINA